MATFKIIGRALAHNGRSIPVGGQVELGDADGAILGARGRVEPHVVEEVAAPDEADAPKKKPKSKKGA